MNTANIFFLLEDTSVTEQNNQENIQKMLDEINDVNGINNVTSLFACNYLYYDTCNVKELLKICQYYDIAKNNKITKCKRQDLINIIVWFENLAENYDIVCQRNKMWSYIAELNNDSKMKKYLLWV
jgi:hypothetical protein